MKKTILLLLVLLTSTLLFASTAVVYFSATGNTERVANVIAEHENADIYEIVPSIPYSSADLNWRNDESRVNQEHNDPSFRPAIEAIPSLESYDTIFLGYPLWWQQAPHAVYTFVENTDLSGKTIIPFATSQASPLGNSAENLESASDSDATWLEGIRFRERASDNVVISWLESLNI